MKEIKEVHCRQCGRKLKGALSMKRGIGPGCRRKKFGQQNKFSYAMKKDKIYVWNDKKMQMEPVRDWTWVIWAIVALVWIAVIICIAYLTTNLF